MKRTSVENILFKLNGDSLWFVRIKNSLKTQKYENRLNDILGCLFNQFLHELNGMGSIFAI